MKAQDYFYYMDLLDKCGFYKEADDVYSLVRTAQRTDLDDTILPGVVKNKGNKVPQNYNIYGRPTGWRSLPRNMNQGGGLDGTTVLPPSVNLGLDGDTVLPSVNKINRNRNIPSWTNGETILPGVAAKDIVLNPFVDELDRTVLPGDPNAHLFKKLELIHQEFVSQDNRTTANGAPAYSLNPRLFKQLAKKYFLPEILVNSLLADESKVNQVNQNKNAFFTKAAQLEALAVKNPKAWERFINSTFATRMISNKLHYAFKSIGTGSKSLSQSLKGLNMNSPYWALIGPALEFGLYQFGLYLENPSAYNLQSQEQSTISQLNGKITQILADNKITDKKGYFMQNYGSTLKTLGTMEQSQLLNKFPVMPFNQGLNIMKNIGQK
jgi:hypothetical protein